MKAVIDLPPGVKPHEYLGFLDQEKELLEQAVRWVQDEAAARGWEAAVSPERVRYSETLGILLLPTALESRDTAKGEDESTVRLDIEDSWNYQEPAPRRRVRLMAPWNPETVGLETPPPLT